MVLHVPVAFCVCDGESTALVTRTATVVALSLFWVGVWVCGLPFPNNTDWRPRLLGRFCSGVGADADLPVRGLGFSGELLVDVVCTCVALHIRLHTVEIGC